MVSSFRHAAPLAVLVALLGLAGSAHALTPGQKAYVEGRTAYQTGDYAAAVRLLSAAVAEDGVEALAKFKYKSQILEDYLPHTYLAISLVKLGRDTEALTHLGQAERQGVGARSEYASALGSARQTLDARIRSRQTPTPVPTTAPIVPPSPTTAPLLVAPPPTATAVAVARAGGTPTRAPSAVPSRPVATPSSDEARLREGVREFFKSGYGEAIKALDHPEIRSRPLGKLFLAYAFAGRSLETGKLDDLPLARELYRAAVQEGARTEPEERLISPAIRKRLKEEGGAPAQKR